MGSIFIFLNVVEVFYCIIRRFGTINTNFIQKIGKKAWVLFSQLLFYLNIKKKIISDPFIHEPGQKSYGEGKG
jgi:hypothetical protein